MPKAFLFDMDGVLVDSETLWVEVVREALAAKSSFLTEEEAHELVYGRAWSDIFSQVQRRFPGCYATIEDMSRVTDAAFAQRAARRELPIRSSIELLRRLAATYPVAVVSGSSRSVIGQILDHLHVRETVRFYLGTEDYTPGKPDPACYLLAAERLGVAPEDCLVFEDSSVGVRAAKAAGMRCIALQRPGSPAQDLAGADAVLPDLAEAPSFIEQFQKEKRVTC